MKNMSNTKTYDVYGFSDKGKLRDKNEDSFWISEQKKLLAVADGMGGHQAGEVASKKAIEFMKSIFSDSILDEFKNDNQKIQSHLVTGLMNINDKIYSLGRTNINYSGMGTTASVVFLNYNQVHACHIGDSRIYIINKKSIVQLGKDHSYVAKQIQKGLMTEEEARYSPLKNRLTKVLGMPWLVVPEYNEAILKKGDRLLICSDGLWDMLSDLTIQKIVKSSNDAKSISNNLVNEANNAGGEDNITVIIVIF
jgi:PPM family protein phosphatase